MKQLAKSFFEKERPKMVNNFESEVHPMVWNKEVLEGKKKVLFDLPINNAKTKKGN